jgi:hypothetical protein
MRFSKRLMLAGFVIQSVMVSAIAEPRVVVSTANAIDIKGQWEGKFYYMTPDELVGQYANTNGHCLKRDGTWYMTNNSASGRWFRVGDKIYLHGGGNGFSGSAELTVIKPKVITGHWQSWTADDSFHAFFTAYWKRTSRKCLPPFDGGE